MARAQTPSKATPRRVTVFAAAPLTAMVACERAGAEAPCLPCLWREAGREETQFGCRAAPATAGDRRHRASTVRLSCSSRHRWRAPARCVHSSAMLLLPPPQAIVGAVCPQLGSPPAPATEGDRQRGAPTVRLWCCSRHHWRIAGAVRPQLGYPTAPTTASDRWRAVPTARLSCCSLGHRRRPSMCGTSAE
jgi:hypothetical protein